MPDPQSANTWLERFATAFPQAGHVALGFDVPHGTGAHLAWLAGNGVDVEVSAVMTVTEVHPPRNLNRDDNDVAWFGAFLNGRLVSDGG